MAVRTQIITANNLGSSFNVGIPSPLPIGGRLTLGVNIDNGSGAAPSDTPAGAWYLQVALDDKSTQFFRVFDADTDLAKVAPNGNNVVNGCIAISGFPGTACRLAYVRTSGGGTSSVCNAWIEVQ